MQINSTQFQLPDMNMRAFRFLFFVLCMTSISSLVADEGMHPISQIDTLGLQGKGLEIDVRSIFNETEPCVVDGICRVNGCTGSFVSERGLIITNHHCAYRAIQSASTAQQDYLKNGFQAATIKQEIPATGYVVRVTESFRDVSNEVLTAVNPGMNFIDRTKAIERRQKELEQAAEQQNPGMRAEVAEMFTGKTYFLFLYTYIKDVRLVFAPPESVGSFGGDIDNWEWPRHTGDFSFMRAYVAPDGSSADYSPNNVPYQPKKFIRVAPQGVDEGDFVMLLGYPGRTARHKTASFLKYEQDVRLPYIVDSYSKQIEILEKEGKNNRDVALKNLSRIKGLANTEKRSRGQLKGLNRAKIVAQRMQKERELQSFIEQDPARRQEYGNLLNEISGVYQSMTAAANEELPFDGLRRGCQVLSIAYLLYDAAVERQKPDLDREAAYMDRNFDQTTKRLSLAQQNVDVATDKKLWTLMSANVDLAKLGISNVNVDQLYASTRLLDPDFLQSSLKMSPSQLAATQDPFLQLISRLHPEYSRLRAVSKSREGQLNKLYGELQTVKQQFMQTQFVPDANSTLRLTFGTVRGYWPEDAVYNAPITTLGGVIAKTTGMEPFVTPNKIVEMHSNKEFGKFAHPKLKDVPVAILYDTDTTGGNSGSPILNARGELVGVNFDRAFEATINDFAWNTNYSRSIGVDIRYALWITGDVYGANHLLSEMGIDCSDSASE